MTRSHATVGWIIAAAVFPATVAAQTAAPTFAKDIASLVNAKCVMCHRPGEVAPMSLRTYDEVRPWARAIKAKVVSRQMPPWHAEGEPGKWRNDRRLTGGRWRLDDAGDEDQRERDELEETESSHRAAPSNTVCALTGRRPHLRRLETRSALT